VADVTERMLRLLATLQGGGSFSGEDLARRLGVSPRTLRRDVDRLRAYGYPVMTRPGPGGHYRFAVGQRLPPLLLEDDEAVAVVIGLAALTAAGPAHPGALADAAGRAYGKVDTLLPARLRSRAAALRTTIEAERAPAPEVSARTLGTLAEAIAAGEIVAFDYRDAGGRPSARRVEAHRQVSIDLTWYLLGWDLGRGDWRVFRTDRIANLLRTGARHAGRALPAETALEFLRSGLGRAAP